MSSHQTLDVKIHQFIRVASHCTIFTVTAHSDRLFSWVLMRGKLLYRVLRKYWILLLTINIILLIYSAHIDVLSTDLILNLVESYHPIDVVTPQYINSLGYLLYKNNVKFSFINSKKKNGTTKEITKQNLKLYEEIMNQEISTPKDFDIESIRPPKHINQYIRENATISTLVRENELNGLISTITMFEEKFNLKFQYPYTIMNDKPFSENFKNQIISLTKAKVTFVLVPTELWSKPSSINEKLELLGQKYLSRKRIPYAKSKTYRSMCRFYSGNFYNVPEMQKYKYYWRIEPNVKFFNDVNYDVFKYLNGTGKIYGFTVGVFDNAHSIESLWPETLKYLNIDDNYKSVNNRGSFQFLLDNLQQPERAKVAGDYSTCHFWSNFEIADMDFWRSDAYNNWFKYLESTGKFYYERWGDAPVHSIGLGLFADKSKIHWFRDIGYQHKPYQHCPNVKGQKSDCKIGEFCKERKLKSSNCMINWIDHGLNNLNDLY